MYWLVPFFFSMQALVYVFLSFFLSFLVDILAASTNKPTNNTNKPTTQTNKRCVFLVLLIDCRLTGVCSQALHTRFSIQPSGILWCVCDVHTNPKDDVLSGPRSACMRQMAMGWHAIMAVDHGDHQVFLLLFCCGVCVCVLLDYSTPMLLASSSHSSPTNAEYVWSHKNKQKQNKTKNQGVLHLVCVFALEIRSACWLINSLIHCTRHYSWCC